MKSRLRKIGGTTGRGGEICSSRIGPLGKLPEGIFLLAMYLNGLTGYLTARALIIQRRILGKRDVRAAKVRRVEGRDCWTRRGGVTVQL
jgi:hypothetical protein